MISLIKYTLHLTSSTKPLLMIELRWSAFSKRRNKNICTSFKSRNVLCKNNGIRPNSKRKQMISLKSLSSMKHTKTLLTKSRLMPKIRPTQLI